MAAKGKEEVKQIEGGEVVDILRQELEKMMVSAPPPKKARKTSCSLGNALNVNSLAALVMKGMRIHISGKAHRILEVELYLTGPGHQDPFTHCSAVQSECGKWYFHRLGNGGYRGGSFKGLDISIGHGKFVGGLLIRTLMKEADGSVITGPSLCVDHILASCNVDSINTLVDDHLHGEISVVGNPLLYMTIDPNWNVEDNKSENKLYFSPRFGLHPNKDVSKSEVDQMWWFLYRPYRFVRCPNLFSKARINTSLGLFSSSGETKSPQDVQHFVGGTLPSTRKWIELYNLGVKDPSIISKFTGQKLSQDEWCRCYGAVVHMDIEEEQGEAKKN